MKEIWKAMEDSFNKTRNTTYDRSVFFSSKQLKGDSVKSPHFEKAKKYCLCNEGSTLIRDTFHIYAGHVGL